MLESVRVELDPPLVWENPFIRYRIGDPDDVAKASILVGLHQAITEGGAPPYGAGNGLRDWGAVPGRAGKARGWATGG